jgi:thiosulfate/3-mercaptopyruvate sulfurtransferase
MTEDSRRALISPGQLAELLAADDKSEKPTLLDVRWQVGMPALHDDYLAGHIPQAQFVDLDADLAGPPGAGGRHPLPDPQLLQDAVRRWGIEGNRPVVAYDGGPSIGAARAWWVLRWAGVQEVRVLDGGFAAWSAAGLPVEAGQAETPRAGNFTIRAGALAVLSASEAAEWAAAGRLLDVRAPERFRGEVEPLDPVTGHIPGARNLPTTENLAEDGGFLSTAALAARFAGHGSSVGVYCGSGVTAAHTALALHEAGIEGVLYPGSWSEWITDSDRPVATGP